MAQRAFDAAEIASVEVRTYTAAAGFADPTPGNDLAARFSIPWTVAVGLTAGGLDGTGFQAEALGDPALRALASRVTVRADRDLDAGYPAGRPAVVTVRLRDGSAARAAAGRPRGDGPEALADPGVRNKPRRLLEQGVGSERARALGYAVDRLAEDGLEPLTDVLRSCR